MGLRYYVVEHAPVISAIGTAAAMLRETIESSAVNPGEAEIVALRREVLERLVAAGADRGTIEVEVEVDPVRSVVRVSGAGAVALERSSEPRLSAEALAGRAGEGWGQARPAGGTGVLSLFEVGEGARALLRVLDGRGRIRLQRRRARTLATSAGSVTTDLAAFLDACSRYGDSGRELPESFLVYRERVVDLSGLATIEQAQALARAEVAGLGPSEAAYVIATERP
jgi:hypothetical protein